MISEAALAWRGDEDEVVAEARGRRDDGALALAQRERAGVDDCVGVISLLSRESQGRGLLEI